ncbi:coagulation factor XIII B chain isoform X1 [Sceloporus undulatus]|uniref:coagulation factor XIII B chain isoform X1 n=1 Tax=Sceloporus undulatus TaxID=8520 RepID=UPI001C4D5E6F|nr:coagulation factor XIII B chain isoform X1 [Sceloporus undulatus]
MGYKSWIFLLLLVAPGGLLGEDKLCELPNIENGRIAPYYYSFRNYYFPMKKNGKLSYSCLAGYTTESGSQDGRINCTTRGWSPAPKCYKKCVKPPLDNGVFSDTKLSYIIWETLQYTCDSGYWTPEGNKDETAQCLQDGWSAQPRCIKATGTCSAPDLPHGHYHISQRVFSPNEKLKYSCVEGYLTTGGNPTEEVLCTPQGWSLLPKCTKLGCPFINPIEHGGVRPRKGRYEEGDVVQFFCLEGYSLKGAELIQCYYFGWSPEPPVCEEIRNKCPPPPQPPNTKVLTNSRTYHHGDTLHLECEQPFEIRGAEDIQCENGKWTSPPKCIEIDRAASRDGHHNLETDGSCSSPPIIENSIIINRINPLMSYKSGSLVEYRCLQFHLMKGSNTIHCIQGSWTNPPICLKPCLINEETFGNYNIEMKWRLEGELYFLHGDTTEFVCKPGYVLSSATRESQLLVQCNNGQLKYPKCVFKGTNENCGSPPSIENGVIVGSTTTNYAHGSTVEYSCPEYHFLQGSRTVSCSRGQWTTPPSCIEPCTLSQEEMANNNLILRWSFDNRPYFLHGEFVEFICKQYHMRPPSSSLADFRVQCQNGQLLYPRCIEIRG